MEKYYRDIERSINSNVFVILHGYVQQNLQMFSLSLFLWFSHEKFKIAIDAPASFHAFPWKQKRDVGQFHSPMGDLSVQNIPTAIHTAIISYSFCYVQQNLLMFSWSLFWRILR